MGACVGSRSEASMSANPNVDACVSAGGIASFDEETRLSHADFSSSRLRESVLGTLCIKDGRTV
jgi:hypothetical protein